MYDVIGDIHGHADALVRLLHELGYAEVGGVYEHPTRRVVFLGDFIDRGPDIRGVLEVARGMVDKGTALAVMGNHELNLLAFHTEHAERPGTHLRPRSYRNCRQCYETVRQLTDGELEEAAAWFAELPLWLEADGLRVVHACWDADAVARIDAFRRAKGTGDDFVHAACDPDGELFDDVELVLKGREARLPDHAHFQDQDGNPRRHVRTRWYEPPDGKTYREYAFTHSEGRLRHIPDVQVTERVVAEARPYAPEEPPVLIGHYWIPGHWEPAPLVPNVACLDYSVAGGGRLAAYRWSGEAELHAEGFVTVPA